MSRAFVDEDSGGDETEDLHEIPLPLSPGARNYMTPEGAESLIRELADLCDTRRPKAAAALAAAEGRSAGAADDSARGPSPDRSEALRSLMELDRRISYLLRMKSLLEVVEPPSRRDRIVFGLAARVRDGAGVEAEYRIVGVDESDPESGRVSWASPIARALLGKRVGETAVVKLPQGEKRLEILGIQ